MKKILLFLVMLLNVAATFAETYTSGGVVYTYTVNGTTASVTNYDANAIVSQSGVVTILGSITPVTGGTSYTVTSIEARAFNGCTLTSVTIPSSVTSIGFKAFNYCSSLQTVTFAQEAKLSSIGEDAFCNCTALSTITIPSSVTSIGIKAFEVCTGFKTTITIPSSVTSIGEGAFQGCTNLPSISVDEKNAYYSSKDGILFNKDKTTLVCYPGGITTSTSYEIPSSVTSIASYAFYECSHLTSINIPSMVSSIGKYAFASCTGLTSVTIPSKVTSIEQSVFFNCTGLTSFTIPSTVTSIGNFAFSSCSNLTSITIPSSVTTIGYYAFNICNSLTSITIPSSITYIGDNSFESCSKLSTVYLPQKTTAASLGSNVFNATSTDIKFYVEDGTGTYDLATYTNANNWSTYATQSNTFRYLPKTVTAAKIATLYLPYEVAIPSGASAYYCKGSDNQSYISLAQLTGGVIPANTPVIVTSENAADFNFLGNGGSTDAISGINGVLKGAASDITNETNKYLTLGQKTNSSPAEYGFYTYTGDKIAANTCYIEKSAATAKTITLSFDGGTTTIDAATATAEPAMKVYYDLQGRRVLNPTKGLYIVNGKKVVINQ